MRNGLVLGRILHNFLNVTRAIEGCRHCNHTQNNKVSKRFVNSMSRGKFRMSVAEALEYWEEKFRKAKVPEPSESIRNILAHVLTTTKLSDVDKRKTETLNEQQVNILESSCKKRLSRMPVQYIIGEWDFRDLNLKMRPPVFIPRPETEMLVDLVSEEIRLKKAEHVLELCCGSGAISLALLKEFAHVKVTAVDQSAEACNLTKENAHKLNLVDRSSIYQSRITDDNQLNFIDNKFDVIVSNPPYVLSNDMNDLEQEIIMYEDLQALDGGEDGLNVIKTILSISSRLLKNESKLFLEVDPVHPNMLREFLRENSFMKLMYSNTHKDFCGKDRFVEIIKIK